MAEFNLVDGPWIPCISPDGNISEYSIRDVLLQSHNLGEICDDSPLVTVAIHRLLLAILYRAFEGPSTIEQWKSVYQTGAFTSHPKLEEYLSKWHDSFYLFHDTRPFMQVAGLDLNKYKDKHILKYDGSDRLMRLAREAPDKKGRILFDHRFNTGHMEYKPNQIAKMILAAQSFSGTGVASAGKIYGQTIKPTPCQFANCVNGLVVWIQGKILFETLLLNLIPRTYILGDKPAWEDNSIIENATQSWKTPIRFTGPIQQFAPLSRFIRIIDYQSMFFTNGLKTVDNSDDPMKAYFRESIV
ncbi:type I-E CRISPR-associated protein Cse1/CasA [Dehalococcoides mccartyi]|uniref:type I-E CRISPR-associated protein Cse1/CasA n=1 Tax=Dehalococcoides mccartyi TaxID=61435 RepID=UPI0019D91C5C|nr:type I-E CRISPR-associated protein Cse1/CasA [Dehalococcoides mccartyi]MBF4481736.1 type I-E CRISPR-associated protein Cse1/CasA [Dehalococcoides mccartyi]MBJ7531494.1 type I-E CRISPR-associated protein Cse1/CasA [Dehalococcoides mccartyi]